MIAPPQDAVVAACEAARTSPCAKSRRGVSAYIDHLDPPRGLVVLGASFNGPPAGLGCDGSESCRRDCAKRCLHAESRAIRMVTRLFYSPALIRLVHVKIDEHGELVAGGGPSCWQCSREVLDVGLAGVWLYEGLPGATLADRWHFYDAPTFHRVTLETAQIGGPR